MSTKYFVLGVTALLAVGAGCNSTSTNDAPTVNVNSPVNTNTTTTTTTDTTVTNTDSTTSSVTNDDTTTTPDTTTTTAAPTVQEFDVVASQFEFTPSTITVQKGDTVKLNLSSSDVPHGFSLAAFDVSETLTAGKTKTVEFVADQAGTFNFTCHIVCGAGHSSMTGQLIVQE